MAPTFMPGAPISQRFIHGIGGIIAVLGLFTIGARATAVPMTISDLRCEYQLNPLGIDAAQPRLSWILLSAERNQRQSAYQILVACSEAILNKDHGDIWDSGKVSSDNSVNITFAGKPLVSAQELFWKVRVWDSNGRLTAWSESAHWTMGFLKPEDWKAKWIIPRSSGSGQVKGALVIRNATYSARNGESAKDVTDRVAQKVENGRLRMEIQPSALGGDPAPESQRSSGSTTNLTAAWGAPGPPMATRS